AAAGAYNPTLISRNTVRFGRNVSVSPVNSLATVAPLTRFNGGHVRLTPVTRPEAGGRPSSPTRQSFAATGRHLVAPAVGAPAPGPGVTLGGASGETPRRGPPPAAGPPDRPSAGPRPPGPGRSSGGGGPHARPGSPPGSGASTPRGAPPAARAGGSPGSAVG